MFAELFGAYLSIVFTVQYFHAAVTNSTFV